jgi:hypothetical protein
VSRHFRWAILVLVIPIGGTPAQIEISKAPASAVEVRFADGSAVRMELLQEHVQVITKYGKLTVPTSEIRRVEFGLHLPDEASKRVEDAVKRLASNVHADREAASKELVALGYQAYPAAYTAQKSTDREVARRAEEVVKRIREKVPPHLLRLRSNDRLETVEFPITGLISSTTIKARSAYFGEKELRIADLYSIRALGGSGAYEVNLDAAKHGSPGSPWLDTGIEVDADVGLTINTSGRVDLWQDGTGQYATGPNGYQNQGGAIRGMGRQGGQAGAHPGGALLGRIGEGGETFFVGEQYKGKTSREGRLFLLIAPSPWGNPSVGSYQVKINVAGSP